MMALAEENVTENTAENLTETDPGEILQNIIAQRQDNHSETNKGQKSLIHRKKIIALICSELVLCILFASLLCFVKIKTEKDMVGVWMTNSQYDTYDYLILLFDNHEFEFYKYYRYRSTDNFEKVDFWDDIPSNQQISIWKTNFADLTLLFSNDGVSKSELSYNVFSGELYQSDGPVFTKTDINIDELK